jgi:hypothetical protein
MLADRLNLRVTNVEDLARACARFHDFPFELEAQQFDAVSRTWTGYFLRGSDDPGRVVTRRWLRLLKVVEFPVIQVRVTIRNVVEAEIQDRAQIGRYTFRQLHRTGAGCRFEFHQDCDIFIEVEGPLDADVRDVAELSGTHGSITSVGIVDFGIRVGADIAPPREREET